MPGAPGGRILVEGGPRLLGDFYAGRLVDEQFLTLAPQIAGRDAGDRRLSLVMGRMFAPGKTPWGTLIDARRGGSHLFLRYSFPRARLDAVAGIWRAMSASEQNTSAGWTDHRGLYPACPARQTFEIFARRRNARRERVLQWIESSQRDFRP
jgi:hypothetical protein